MRILIANRGEIARRIIRTAHRIGHETVAVYADPDRHAPFVSEATTAVRIGPADLAASYLNVEGVLAAAVSAGSDAVHPGYGFLSENAGFARAVVAAGLVWIGPHPDAIERMGSKIEARRLAASAGVPVIPGFDESQDRDDLVAAAAHIGFPVLVKASAGGGGKGIRIAWREGELAAALDAASAEARRSFGDGALIVERFIERPRHIEVQIVGDAHGNVIDLGTRECSVQRRYQKLLEEAPAPNLPGATRKGLRESARALAAQITYDSAGTVEFVVDDETGEHYFLEMNTRLQVEHPVTEEVTGLDIVELQIAVASGGRLPITQDDVVLAGHAIEVRINAEDPAAGFVPQTGAIHTLVVPSGVRWESGVVAGSVVTPFYDPMLAKLIVAGEDRSSALSGLRRALDQLLIGGVVTNTGFHRWLIDQQPVCDGRVTTRFLDETALPSPDAELPAHLAAAAWREANRRKRAGTGGPWLTLDELRVTPHRSAQPVFLLPDGGATALSVARDAGSAELVHTHAHTVDVDRALIVVNVAGASHGYRKLSRIEHWSSAEAVAAHPAGAIAAPFPAVVAQVAVGAGDEVHPGDVLVVIEAMKMLHSLTAQGSGIVADVHVVVGDQVAGNQVLVTFEDHPERIHT